MYKKTSDSLHFQEMAGSFANRISARGYWESNNPLDILPSLKEQYDTLVQRVEHVRAGNQRADLIRQIGDMRVVLENGTRLAFEAIFVRVAQARLPKDTFLTIVDEARGYWRREGFSACVPPPSNSAKRKIIKRSLKYSDRESHKI